jgi:hypothetical protein
MVVVVAMRGTRRASGDRGSEADERRALRETRETCETASCHGLGG